MHRQPPGRDHARAGCLNRLDPGNSKSVPLQHPAPDGDTHIPTRQIAMFALPILPISLVNLPLAIVLPAFYAANTATTLTAIGVVSFFARAFDAIADPTVGYLSDHWHTRFGRRKPWILAGSLVAAVAIFFLFSPPRSAGIAYYTLWSFVFYVGYACWDIPQKAWSSELSRRYSERSRIAIFATAASVGGAALFWLALIAQVPFTHSTEINITVFRAIAVAVAALLPLSVIAAITFVPNGVAIGETSPSLRDIGRAIRGNRLLLRFALIVGLWQLGNGTFQAVFFIFIAQYLKLGPQFAFIMLLYFGLQIASMPPWLRILYRFGKHRPWALSWALNAVIPIGVLFVEPGPGALVPAVVMSAAMACISAGGNVVPLALLGDVVDYEILRTGANQAGSFFAFQNVLTKLCQAAGLGIGLPLIAWFGYRAGAPIEGSAKLGLEITYIALPGILQLAAAAVAWNFPLDARRHEIVRRRIEQRAARQHAAAPAAAASQP
jgi:glycoside/pentoside/hexuronide:cation symporter, GPH family